MKIFHTNSKPGYALENVGTENLLRKIIQVHDTHMNLLIMYLLVKFHLDKCKILSLKTFFGEHTATTVVYIICVFPLKNRF